MLSVIQEFVCSLYGVKNTTNVDEAGYKKICTQKGKLPEPHQIPPTEDELVQHCKRVAFVSLIIKQALEPSPDIPSPDGHGWRINSANELEVEWMTKNPAPDSILELIACKCKKSKCVSQSCTFLSDGLKCTDVCDCTDCSNEANEEEEW